MSTGNPNPNQIPKKSEQIKEIPLSWFTAIGVKGKGIFGIAFSKEFESLGSSKLKEYIADYKHHMGNNFVGNRLVKDASEIQNEEYRTKAQTAETKIKEITGFNAKELSDKLIEFNELYKGKQEAPMEITWG